MAKAREIEREIEMNITTPFAGMEVHVIANNEEHVFTVSEDHEETLERVERAREFLNDHVKVIKVGGDNA